MKSMKSRLLILPVLFVLCGVALVSPAAAVDSFMTTCAGLSLDNLTTSAECDRLMEAFPRPVVLPIRQDGYTLDNYSFWKVTNSAPNLYDAPNGGVIGQMPAGFNFVHAVDFTDGWVKNREQQWMQTDDLKFVQPSFFRGVQLLDGLQNEFGWVLGDLMTVPEPGAQQSMETGIFKARYDLVNIFAEVKLGEWYWYMVGPDQWIEQRSIALAKPVERPDEIEGRWVAVDLYEQTLVAYENDTPVFATLIASGLPGWDTPEGIHTVWARVPTDRMAGATGAPDAYALESVPWVMYFEGGISLHGTYWHDGFGYRRSHGCVNLSISDASYLFRWTGEGQPDTEDNIGTPVYVYASGEYRGRGPATK
ncbi:MAG: L,D-transpeptidase [Anaerolineae bacterium]|nr:L,D-transpeptidase [Anaerolineae bacterium]